LICSKPQGTKKGGGIAWERREVRGRSKHRVELPRRPGLGLHPAPLLSGRCVRFRGRKANRERDQHTHRSTRARIRAAPLRVLEYKKRSCVRAAWRSRPRRERVPRCQGRRSYPKRLRAPGFQRPSPRKHLIACIANAHLIAGLTRSWPWGAF
jgi:hypothetical protein